MAGQFTRTERPTPNGNAPGAADLAPKAKGPRDRALTPAEMTGLLNVKQAAARLGLPASFVYEDVAKGADARIPHIRIGRHVRFDPAALEEWIHAQTLGGKGERREDHPAPRPRVPSDPARSRARRGPMSSEPATDSAPAGALTICPAGQRGPRERGFRLPEAPPNFPEGQ